ncbi:MULTISPECIES: chemotaxis protein CheW [unclassified Methanosarcina]|uniref:chemotaxis protein CheW n=1 Tax=unclassified Methanosarcina TaxID=2644672 RepID=UPI000622250D|nr:MULTISPECIES: chemotaxis protein CheW [unclassified Methanosarcina]KKG15619.1 chemotaxis protein [Methanosarcina sp. 2.H.T.1A.3]KKG27520.1 chemotaxis protein [Methanosarcina sp. 2.H.T.1A.8]
MESDMAAYKSDFLQEIYECLDVFNQSFVDLENGDSAAIDEIFRITHTIKGMAGFLGYTSLEHLCHSMEEVLCGIKNGDIEIDGELVDILLSTVDRIMEIVKQIESADNDNVKIEDLLNAFDTYEKMMTGGQGSLCIQNPVENKVSSPKTMSIQQSDDNTSSNSECHDKQENEVTCNPDDYNLVLDVVLSKDCVMKGLRAALIIESLRDISKLAKIDPDENEMDNSFDGHFKVFISGDSKKVEDIMDKISEIEHFNISEIKPLNIACNEEIKCNSSLSVESQSGVPSKMENEVPCNPDDCNPDDCNPDDCNPDDCNLDDCNLVLDVTLSKDCVMKGLRATLIIESLKDISKLAKIDPDENEMDNSFDGHFKMFLSGESDEVEELMDRISEIEQFNISEIKPLNIACDEEIKCNSSLSVESQPDTSSTPVTVPEATAVSATNKSNILHSCMYSLAARLRCILNRISKSINCFKITEYAGILPRKKCKDSSTDGPKSQEVRVLEKDFEINHAIPYQEVQLNEARILEPGSGKTFDKGISDKGISDKDISDKDISDKDISDKDISDKDISDKDISDKDISGKGISDKSIPDKSIPDQELQLDKAQSPAEDSENISTQGLKSQEIQETGESEKDSINHLSESATSVKAPMETKRQETIRVRTSNLDNIMNLVGELVINKGRLLQISQEYNLPELEEATGTLDKSISSLQDEVMRIRMVKIERIFSKFPRMVRDLSRKFNKNVEFEIEGQDTELDRTILDEISDPLVHLVRNAVDHGIEYPEEREKAGKNDVGHIKLSARREKNNVIIEIEDNGKGIDVEILKKKAVEKGILSSFDVENLSEEEIRMIIFSPGFSTKDAPTEISGRGVGMDVVKTTVEKLGGKVRVYSKKGEFSRIRIDLPPTVAIIKSLLVEVGSETYAIPISNVVKALSVDSSDYKLVKETPVLYIRDKLIPTVELKEIFNVTCEKLDNEIAIIVEKENEEIGLIVDSIIDQQEIVIKPLGNIFSNSKGFIGATILGDGRVIPIIDVSMLIKGDIDD